MARRSQCSSAGDDPLNPNYLPPHYREEYRLAVDALVEDDLDGYYQFLLKADVVDFLSSPEIEYIRGAVQVPQGGEHLEQRVLEGGADGSSDTYWPLHSDLDAPGLDLGWPQTHHFIGPTEVTTLVNPPEPDMPSVKEQARRLIKNAKQVVAIVMDMFTDVDIFADILAAAMRNVAVYVLLDKENVHHFINMAANCRVDLQSIQFLRVRTVSGITYHCRSGKSFTGQMMDRFLLTDCRAVLSGNYSFMWSFEKLHRCMAHLFLGQLVSTFDEEFRILFAQSEPLIMDNMLPPVEDFSQSQKRKYPCERALLYTEPKRYLSLDTAHPDEWVRHPHEDRTDLDWRMMPHKRPDVQCGPAEVYGRFSSQQPRLDPPFDQYSSRIPMMDNPAFKRHSYAEGGHGRYSLPFLQSQEVLEPEPQGRQFHRGQQLYPDYSGYERFWNQDFDSADQYCEQSLPPELDRHENFDPVLNYLSSTRNTDFEQAPEKIPAADLHFGSSQPRRLSLGQPYACQTSPTPSNPSDQKHHFLESNPDRKDPAVKRGLRNWRISSFLSAYDNPGDDGRPSTPPNAPDPFEDPSASIQKTATGMDLAVPKIPNVREFKIPALPRASQMPSYAKATTKEPPKKAPEETMTAESRSTPTPSESSSTAEGEKTEEVEPKEQRTIQREESFRRKYNPAVQRSSRLRSSLIFSSLDQQHPTQDNKGATGEQDQESDKNEAEQKKPSYISPVFGQRRSTPREPLEWSRYLKSSTFENSATDAPKVDNGDGEADRGQAEGRDDKVDGGDCKTDDTDSEKDKGQPENTDIKEPSNVPVLEQGNATASTAQLKSSVPTTDSASQPWKPSFMAPVYVDMNDPDQRFLFFKELAAKRKAEKAAEAEQNKPPTDPMDNATVKGEPIEHLEKKPGASQHFSEKHAPAEVAEKTDSTESVKTVSQHSDQSKEGDSFSKKDAKTPQSAKDEQTRNSTESEKNEPKQSQLGGSLHVSAENQTPKGEKSKLLNPTEKKGCPLIPTNPVPDTPTEETPHLKSTSHHPPSLTWLKTTLSSCEKQKQSEQSCEIQAQSGQRYEKQDQPEQSCEKQDQSEQSSSSDIVSGSQVSLGQETKHPEVAPADSLTSTVSSLQIKDCASQSDHSQPNKNKPAEDNLHPVSSLMTPDNRSDVSDSSIPSGEPSVGLEVGYHSCSDVSQLIASEEQVTSNGTAPSSGTPLPYLPDQQSGSRSDLMPIPSAGPQTNPSIAQTPSSELCSSPETLKTPGTPTGSGVPPLTETVLTQEPTTQRPSDFFSQHPPTPTSPTSISPQMVSPRKTRPTTLISPTMTTDAATVSQTPTSLTAISQTLTSPSTISPSTISPTPTSPSTISQMQTSPTISQTPTSPSKISQTPTSPSTVSQTPTSPSMISPTKRETSDGDLLPHTAEGVCPVAPLADSPVPPESTNGREDISSECETANQSEPPDVTTESDQTTDQVEEKTNDADVVSEEAVPPPIQSKHQKSTSSRYHSSTASVLSSSNLRDDTKLLLEQISANSQNRNEAAKESAVTDDEKEDEADKNAKREKNLRGIHSLSRAPPKTSEEREKLLERIQSMRKERKVYSRFEMGP